MLQNIDTLNTIQLPSLGEGIEHGAVVAITVAVGDTIEKEQTIIEVETDKATMEVPSPIAGIVEAILIEEGADISVGQDIIRLQSESIQLPNLETDTEPPETPISEVLESEIVAISTDTDSKQEPIAHDIKIYKSSSPSTSTNRATPKAKKLARELNVDIGLISNNNEFISEQKIKYHVSQGQHSTQASPVVTQVDHTKWGNTSEKPMTGMQRATSQNMTESWRTIPHAWLTENANVTALERHRKEINKTNEIKLSATIFVIKAVAHALNQFPIFNASIDLKKQMVIYKDYINIGVAVDTEFGLYVPIIKQVNTLSLTQIAQELSHLSELAKSRKLSKQDMEGGTITISNLGGIGTSSIFPVILSPQVSIIGLASFQTINEEKYLPMTIGFDHRIINGADAARFIQYLKSLIETPVKMLA